MQRGADPTVQRRRLRRELRAARTKAGLSQRQAAEALAWSESKLLRIEAGQVGVSRTDLKAMLELYGITDQATIETFSRMAQESRRQPWSDFRDVLNPEYLVYLGHEGTTSRLRQFEALLIPGLLQTEDYARAVIDKLSPPDTPEHVIKRQIKVRMERQKIMERPDAPHMSFVLDEAAIRRWVGSGPGDSSVMYDQLLKLGELASRPTVTIQILKFSQGIHSGLGGAFVVLEFPDDDDADVLYLENNRGPSALRDDPEEVARYRQAFGELASMATPPTELDSFLEEVLDTMRHGTT